VPRFSNRYRGEAVSAISYREPHDGSQFSRWFRPCWSLEHDANGGISLGPVLL